MTYLNNSNNTINNDLYWIDSSTETSILEKCVLYGIAGFACCGLLMLLVIM